MNNTVFRRVAIYARVSKPDRKKPGKPTKRPPKAQDPENQLRQLREWCARGSHKVIAEYVEKETGTKGPETRKALSALLSDAHQRKFDLVLFWSLDRFSREGMTTTVGYLQRLTSSGVSFHSYTEEWLSTDNEMVRDILLAVMSSLAKQEAIKISERTKAGLERAKAKGKKLGRPNVDRSVLAAIVTDKAENPEKSERALARDHGVSRGSVRVALQGKTD
ncbi:MAG: recombinase family protein [Pseudomonadota bacterium]